MKTFVSISICLIALILSPCFAELEKNIEYGNKAVDYLRKRYPQHFTLRTKAGNTVSITNEDLMGSYLVSIFSQKTPSGWLHCAGRPTIGATGDAGSQCLFYEMLKVKHDGVEILINPRYDAKDSSSEKFWTGIFFEAQNAMQGKEFVDVMNSFSEKKITSDEYAKKMMRIEYKSSQEAQKFQEQVWNRFCKDNGIIFSEKYWFFPPETTFDQAIERLKGKSRGRRYIEGYAKAPYPEDEDEQALKVRRNDEKK